MCRQRVEWDNRRRWAQRAKLRPLAAKYILAPECFRTTVENERETVSGRLAERDLGAGSIPG